MRWRNHFIVPMLFSAVLLLPAGSRAGEVRPFVSGTLARIQAAHAGRPFILAFWSIDCVHCPVELKHLAALKKAHPELDVVLVATDTPDVAQLVSETVARHGLDKVEQWVFADSSSERLRYEIDPHWYGELPRSYLYDARHRVEATSGVVSPGRLAQWARRQRR